MMQRAQQQAEPVKESLHEQVISSLISHIHSFIREHVCDEKRQEFILPSDITGVTMLDDAINHRLPDGATTDDVSGIPR